MRSSIFCVFLFLLSFNLFASFKSLGQNINEKNIKLTIHGKTLKDALQDLQKASGFNIFYPSAKINNKQKIALTRTSGMVGEWLKDLLKDTELTFQQQGDRIIIFEQPEKKESIRAQTKRKITGIVMDEGGTPLPGVNIRTKTTMSLGTRSDHQGHFNITVEADDEYLIFSYIGYTQQEVSIKEIYNLQVSLKPAIGSLNEVLVIGYGTSKKKDLTGSVSRVTSKTIETQPVGNVLNSLQGRMAGVEVSQGSGLPNSSTTIRIRGQRSIGASGSEPLYVVDGVPFNFNLNVYTTGPAGGTLSPFNSLNPSDIESIDVLKDADATAIYGARGGNGVILITTKRGKSGKTKLDINANTGFGKVGRFIDMLSGEQYLELRKEAFANDGVTPTTVNAPDLTVFSQTAFHEWQQELIGGTSAFSDMQMTLSGGNDRTNFVFSPNYHHESTVYPGDFGEDRFSGRMSIDHKSANNKFTAQISTAYSYDKHNLPTTDLSSLYNLPPNYNPYTETGAFNFISGLTNPYASLAQKYNTNTANFIGNLSLQYQVMKDLTAKVTAGYTTLNFRQQRQVPASTISPFSGSAQVSNATFGDTEAKSYIVEPQVEYNRQIAKGKLNVLLGTTFQRNISNTNTVNGTNYGNDALLGSMAAAGTLTSSTSFDEYNFTSVFGRINYNWEGKYIINGTLRRDGSSRFGANHRFGNFGAIGAAWIFTEEPFLKNQLSFLSFGKLRGSFGITGNDQISNYQYLATYTAAGSTAAYQGVAVQNPSRLANQDIQWESNRKMEAALDLGFLQDRITMTVAVYRNRMGNQLIYISTPGQIGFTSYLGNFPATIRNQGLELEINSTNIQKDHFSWNTSFNFTLSKTILTSFNSLADQSFYSNSYQIGFAVPFNRQYVVTGINPNNGVIQYQTNNANGLPTYAVDQVPNYLGNPYFGGINNTFTFRQFDFGFFFQFRHQYGYINGLTGALGSMNNQNSTVLDRWQQVGDQTRFPGASATSGKPIYNAYSFYYNSSSAMYGNASWLKLRNVNVGYTFKQAVLTKLNLSRLRIYAQAQNLFSVSNYENAYDPETGTSMPALRTIVFGLNASF